jgi:FKBP-type peptidyl-prolyl cis-trans isomerase
MPMPERGRARRSPITVALLSSLIIAWVASACSNSPTSPSNHAPFSQSDLRAGTGATAASGQTLSVNYTGWFYDASKPDQKGLIFDSTRGRSSAFTFTLGTGAVIGADRVCQGCGWGPAAARHPAVLAYGPASCGSIPPNSTLLFEIEF